MIALQLRAADALTEALQKGLFEEEANHNLDAAIKAYQSVLAQADEQRRVAATAMFRLAECYRKQGKTNEATAEYGRLLRDYADQTTLATLSRQNLAGLGVAAPAAAGTPPAILASTDAEEKEIRRIKAMIKDSPDLVNARTPGPGGSTVLHSAASQGHFLVTEFLLANGADVNARDLYNEHPNNTPLHMAAANGHKRIVELLLAKGAAVNAADWSGRTPLHNATSRGFRAIVEVLLHDQADVNARDSSGWTPLHVAVSSGHEQITELLIEKGADLNVAGDFREGSIRIQGAPVPGGTPLHLSIQMVKPRLTRLLLEKGADPNARASNGLTPLHVTAQLSGRFVENLEMAKLLLERKADVDARVEGQNFRGWTALMLAVNNGMTNLVALLLKNGAKPDVPGETTQGSESTPLQVAIGKRSHGMAKLLLDNGADVNMRAGQNPPLFQAIYPQADVPMVELLLAYKPDLTARAYEGYAPLLMAVSRENLAISELLLKAGANPNDTNDAGMAAIHIALGSSAPSGSVQVSYMLHTPPRLPTAPALQPSPVPLGGAPIPSRSLRQPSSVTSAAKSPEPMLELLLDYKANPNLRGSDGYTPLQIAVQKQRITAAGLLLAKGADPNARAWDRDGDTALHWAVRSGYAQTTELLLANKADPNATNAHGATPLHYIGAHPPTNVIALLVKHGADVNACDKYASTPLHNVLSRASEYKRDAVRFLLEHGADVTKTCDGNQSPFDYGTRYNTTEEIVEMLRKHHPKKLAKISLRGPVGASVWFSNAGETKTLSQVFKSVGLSEKADPRQIKILRNDPVTGLLREMTYDLEAIRENRAKDVPVQDGDKIIVAER